MRKREKETTNGEGDTERDTVSPFFKIFFKCASKRDRNKWGGGAGGLKY